jgi:hypothetical protein
MSGLPAFARRSFAVLTCAVAVAAAAPASAALVSSYDFNGDLTDTLGNGADLVSFGGSLATAGLYTFGNNQGLRLNSAFADPATYAIEIRMQMTANTSFWKKIVDYQNLLSDTGVYIRSSSLTFFNTTLPGPAGIPVLTDAVLALTRDGTSGLVQGFVDGALQWSFNDTTNVAVSVPNILHFFIDDNFNSESFPGTVDYIRIFDSASTEIGSVPEPGTLAVLGLGLAAVGFARRRASTHGRSAG